MTTLVALAQARLADPAAALAKVTDQLALRSVELTIDREAHLVRLAAGHCRLRTCPGGIEIEARAASDHDLFLLKHQLASLVRDHAPGGAAEIAWTGHGAGLVMPPNFCVARVVRVREIGRHFRRLTLAGSDLGRFDRIDALHCTLWLPRAKERVPVWPSVGPDGIAHYPKGRNAPVVRRYTIREVAADCATVLLDLLLHPEGGPGTLWAAQVEPGDVVGLYGPGGGGLASADWYLLAGDETALPAIARMLEAMPRAARGVALIEVEDAGDEISIACPDGVTLRWLHRRGASAGTTTLLADALAALPPPPDGTIVYAWAGCEHAAFRSIRARIAATPRLQRAAQLLMPYWRRHADRAATR